MKHAFWSILLLLSIFGETALFTFGKNFAGSPMSPAIWLISGMATAIAGFFLIGFKTSVVDQPLKKPVKCERFLVFGIFIAGMVYCAVSLTSIFAKYPIDASASDIVPSMELYARRFLAGEKVYTTLVFEHHNVDPTYFPLMWLPYIVPEILNMDYRWAPFGLFMIVLYFYYWQLSLSPVHWLEKVFKACVPFFILSRCFMFAESMFGYAVELVPVAYYMILTGSLSSKNRWLTGLGILVCLLSRYAFTFWLPVYFILILATEGWKSVFRMSAVAVAGVLLLYILPFLMKDPAIFTKGLAYYDKTAVGQWQIQGWQSPGDKPYHLTHGLSFSEWIYDHVGGDMLNKLSTAKKIHLIACFFSAVLMLLVFIFYRNKSLDINCYALVALKFYLTVFYGFWYVPFPYLYTLPLFISIPILFKTKIFTNFAYQN